MFAIPVVSLLGFAACLFALYSLMPLVIARTSAAAVNLNLLSADFYALIAGIFLFKYQVHVVATTIAVCISWAKSVVNFYCIEMYAI